MMNIGPSQNMMRRMIPPPGQDPTRPGQGGMGPGGFPNMDPLGGIPPSGPYMPQDGMINPDVMPGPQMNSGPIDAGPKWPMHPAQGFSGGNTVPHPGQFGPMTGESVGNITGGGFNPGNPGLGAGGPPPPMGLPPGMPNLPGMPTGGFVPPKPPMGPPPGTGGIKSAMGSIGGALGGGIKGMFGMGGQGTNSGRAPLKSAMARQVTKQPPLAKPKQSKKQTAMKARG